MPEEIDLHKIKPINAPIINLTKEESDFIDSLFKGESEIKLEAAVVWQLPLFHKPY
jgi:hypothetical protein